MAKHVAAKGKPKQYKGETNPRCAARAMKRARKQRTNRDTSRQEKPLPRLYGNPLQEGIEEIGLPAPDLEGESTYDVAYFALGYVQELAARVKQRCSDEKLTDLENRADCKLFVNLVSRVTKLVYYLALEFRMPFRKVAEERSYFPCLFPAHPETLRGMQKMLRDDLNLGKRDLLKVRPARGRKTFSFETWVNEFLFHYICEVSYRIELNRYESSETDIERLYSELPTPANARQWLDEILELLLIDIPEPEKHPRLRQLGKRPSKAHNVRSTIKAKLGTYLERMLNDQAVHE